MAEIRVLNFRVSGTLAREIEERAKAMGLSVSGYLRFLARQEKETAREIESLKAHIAKMEIAIRHLCQITFRAYRYGWFCAMALKEGQIKQVELKIEKELVDYEATLQKEIFNERR